MRSIKRDVAAYFSNETFLVKFHSVTLLIHLLQGEYKKEKESGFSTTFKFQIKVSQSKILRMHINSIGINRQQNWSLNH